MGGLRLGPLLRYVDWDSGDTATVWVEADRPCTAEVRCADGSGGSVRTFQIAGHHYALIPVTGLTPGTTTAYEVLLDGRPVWPLPGSPFPASTISTPVPRAPGGDAPPLRLSFGSCRQAAPPAEGRGPHGPDALDTLAARLAAEPDADRPDLLLLLGDQVYADMLSTATRDWLAARRDLREEPGAQVADYEEFTRLYDESWLDPEIRWLLSTVPSCMIFDDHDLSDDWNTSAAWVAERRALPWWQERVLGGLMSYWVYQHLGNLSPAALAADPLYAAVREAPDGTDLLRRFAAEADADPASVRWSYRRDLGGTRLLMVDTRCARVLDERHRSMLDPDEQQWLRDNALDGHGSYDHLLIGASLPWLLPPLIHDAEGWDAALCRGERGERWARFAEDLRRRSDLEHWAAFPPSFAALTDLIEEVGTGPRAPAMVAVLSGDVHHAYVAEPRTATTSRIFQLTCSPVHNSIPWVVKVGFRFGWSRTGRWLGRMLSRHARTGRPPLTWHRSGGPWFANQLMTLSLEGRGARLRLDQARSRGGRAQLAPALERELTAGTSGPAPSPEEGAHNRRNTTVRSET
ncbi:alkaline phosphatase family protein [Streptomyces bambusae]|uniref:alkaline phosphatase D family protein n=1 Tax=Streptomyces bambusae TaxID=1550616 RepID=UPI001CFF5138|nr:alkaline phosphatase D family protein [Streptomyces bambusae]MCB5164903.1 alkaline phosphatase family protein [Streptomyces bambusae]